MQKELSLQLHIAGFCLLGMCNRRSRPYVGLSLWWKRKAVCIGIVRGYSPGAVKVSKVPKWHAAKRKTAFCLCVMWPKGRHCGFFHEKVGIRARMASSIAWVRKNRYSRCMGVCLFNVPVKCRKQTKAYGRRHDDLSIVLDTGVNLFLL